MKLIEQLNSMYKDSPFIIQKKVKTLFFFNLILILLLPVLLVLLNIIASRSIFSLLNIMLATIILGMGCSLFFLKKGYYLSSANITVISALISLTLYVFLGEFAFKNGIISSLFHLIILIVFSSLFSGKRMTITVFIVVLTAGFGSIIYRNAFPPAETKMILINFSFVAIFIFILSYILISTNRSTMKRLQEDAEDKKNLEQIRALLDSVKAASSELSEASDKMSLTSDSFSGNARNQTASTEQMSANIEEMSAGIENVALGAKDQLDSINILVEAMNRLSETILDVEKKIEKAVTVTGSISDMARKGESGMNEMNESMNTIGDSSKEMTNIVKLINDISDQINLLSLNASIEAARAGDAGRGFAVVADEISKLAEQTSSSVKMIDEHIKRTESEIDRGMDNASGIMQTMSAIIQGVSDIKEMIESINSGMGVQLETNKEVNTEASNVKDRSEQIFNAANEQKIASEEIVKTIEEINELTQSNAEGSIEVLEITNYVASLSKQLKDKVDTFRIEQEKNISNN